MVWRDMKSLRGYAIAFCVAVFATSAASCVDSLNPPFEGTPGVVMLVVFDGFPADTMGVPLTDPQTIASVEQFIVDGQGSHLVIGPIAKGVGYDGRYPFHFIPDSVRVTDAATEACDGAPMHTAAAVDTFFRVETGNTNAASATWCPWSSRPIGVSGQVQIGNSSR
jgi:hypothetical protein